MWIPEGFAHGFVTLTETAEFLYKTTNYYHPESEGAIIWNDNILNIKWPIQEVFLSKKDKNGQTLSYLKRALKMQVNIIPLQAHGDERAH